MSEDRDEEVLSISTLIERRFNEIEDKISEIELKYELEIKKLKDIISLLNIVETHDVWMTTISFELLKHETGELNYFNSLIDSLNQRILYDKKLNIYAEEILLRTIEPYKMIDKIIELSAKWKIPFNKLASYLIDKMGKNKVKEITRKEKILSEYGTEALRIWESL